MKCLRSTGAERLPQTRKQRKTAKNSDFGAKTSCYSSKIQIFEFKFEFQASFCIINLKHYIYEASAEYGRRGDLHGRENSEEQRKTVILAPKRPLQLKNSKFEFKI